MQDFPGSGLKHNIPLGQIPWWHASRTPAAKACIHDDKSIDWQSLARHAAQRARLLIEYGVGLNDMVTFALANGGAFVETVFAIWMAGGIPNPVPPGVSRDELRSIVKLAQPRLIIGGPEIGMHAAARLPADFDASDQPSDRLPDRIATYWKAVPSGGSTGRPKLIVSHRRSLADPTQYGIWRNEVHRGCLGRVNGVVLNTAPLYHNGPFNLMFSNLFVGSTMIGLRRFDAEDTLRQIERHHVEMVYLVPTMMHRIWNLPADTRLRYDLSSLRGVIHMAAPCPAWLKRAWIDWLGPERIWECYGATESQGSTLISGAEWLKHPGSVGRFAGYVENASAKIVGPDGAQVAPGEVGELFVRPARGAGSTYHYVGAEPRMMDGWESVGDLGWMDTEGYLYLTDRSHDLILRGGSNVYPAEVEAVIEMCPGVVAAAVIGLPDMEMGARIHAIVQVQAGHLPLPDEAALAAFVAARLIGYKRPSSYECLTTELRDPTGKLRRSALRAARLAP